MKLIQLIDYLRQHLRAVIRISLAVLAVLVLVSAIPGVMGKEEAHTRFELRPGFWAVYGFVGCVILILVSKWFGHAGIMKREDYYDHGQEVIKADAEAKEH